MRAYEARIQIISALSCSWRLRTQTSRKPHRVWDYMVPRQRGSLMHLLCWVEVLQ